VSLASGQVIAKIAMIAKIAKILIYGGIAIGN
jgi:hypothetical protein